VTTPLGPGDQRRADIKVHLDGTTCLVDVGVVSPGTPRLLAMGTAQTPGRAAAVYNDIKVVESEKRQEKCYVSLLPAGTIAILQYRYRMQL
jgi:hypothetical protein